VTAERLRRVLVGAEDEFFAIPPAPAGAVRVVYVGGFLPLHGVSTMLDAVAILERSGERIEVAMAGTGIDFERARLQAARLALRSVRFLGLVPYEELPRLLGESHIVLGAFGTSEKAGRVIPHKVYQGLAAGRAVVSGDGEGVREVFESGVHLMLAPRGDAESLAEMLSALIRDPARRADLGQAARSRALEIASVSPIGALLKRELEELCR